FLATLCSRTVTGVATLCDEGVAATGFRLTAELLRGFAYNCCRDCAVGTLRCAAMVLPVFPGRAGCTFAVRCCGFALSGCLFFASCAPPAVSASARLPMHSVYRI